VPCFVGKLANQFLFPRCKIGIKYILSLLAADLQVPNATLKGTLLSRKPSNEQVHSQANRRTAAALLAELEDFEKRYRLLERS
jgi:hypothetical protein